MVQTVLLALFDFLSSIAVVQIVIFICLQVLRSLVLVVIAPYFSDMS